MQQNSLKLLTLFLAVFSMAAAALADTYQGRFIPRADLKKYRAKSVISDKIELGNQFATAQPRIEPFEKTREDPAYRYGKILVNDESVTKQRQVYASVVRFDPSSVTFYASGTCTNEEQSILLQTAARIKSEAIKLFTQLRITKDQKIDVIGFSHLVDDVTTPSIDLLGVMGIGDIINARDPGFFLDFKGALSNPSVGIYIKTKVNITPSGTGIVLSTQGQTGVMELKINDCIARGKIGYVTTLYTDDKFSPVVSTVVDDSAEAMMAAGARFVESTGNSSKLKADLNAATEKVQQLTVELQSKDGQLITCNDQLKKAQKNISDLTAEKQRLSTSYKEENAKVEEAKKLREANKRVDKAMAKVERDAAIKNIERQRNEDLVTIKRLLDEGKIARFQYNTREKRIKKEAKDKIAQIRRRK